MRTAGRPEWLRTETLELSRRITLRCERIVPPAIDTAKTSAMILYPNPSVPLGRERPINTAVYPAAGTTTGTRELLSIPTISGYAVLLRSIQYSRIANFLAAATLATPLAMRWQ